MKLSEQLKRDHDSGDFGRALEGYSERAEALEKNEQFKWCDTKDEPLGKKMSNYWGDYFVLCTGSEDLKLFKIRLRGSVLIVAGNLGEDGSVQDNQGNDVGYSWDDVDEWSHIPQ